MFTNAQPSVNELKVNLTCPLPGELWRKTAVVQIATVVGISMDAVVVS